jgi:hypothetical protein
MKENEIDLIQVKDYDKHEDVINDQQNVEAWKWSSFHKFFLTYRGIMFGKQFFLIYFVNTKYQTIFN